MLDVHDLRARMLCYGVRANREDIANYQHLELERGFIHGTIFVLPGGQLVNTSLLDPANSQHVDAVALEVKDDQYNLKLSDTSVPVGFLEQPIFANERFLDAKIEDYLRLHSTTTLFATPVRQCAYIAANKPCLFCTFEQGKVRRLSPHEMVELVGRYKEWRSSVNSLAFGGGSPNLRDFGATYYTRLAAKVKERHPELAVSVEIVPAREQSPWQLLARSQAVDAIISSIEIWDDDIRNRICIGKSELTKDHYLARWASAVQDLGPGNVSSVLLLGLEAPESTLLGAETMIKQGVVPTLIPYRPYEASPLGPRPATDHRLYLQLSTHVNALLRAQGLDPRRQAACTSCGACSLEVPMFDITPRQIVPLNLSFRSEGRD